MRILVGLVGLWPSWWTQGKANRIDSVPSSSILPLLIHQKTALHGSATWKTIDVLTSLRDDLRIISVGFEQSAMRGLKSPLQTAHHMGSSSANTCISLPSDGERQSEKGRSRGLVKIYGMNVLAVQYRGTSHCQVH